VESWKTDRARIDDALTILTEIQRDSWATAENTKELQDRLLIDLVEDTRKGCGSYELRELCSIIPKDADESIATSLEVAFENYVADYFITELRECRSSKDFEGLVDDLDLIGHYLRIDVSIQITKVRAEATEFGELEDQYSDYMQDEWKERWRDQRYDESSVRDMFGSLKDDNE
jgi:hypothetical protein